MEHVSPNRYLHWPGLCAVALLLALVAAGTARPQEGEAPGANETSPMRDSALAMAVALTDLAEQLGSTKINHGTGMFADPLRVKWDYDVVNRAGLAMFMLEPNEQELVWQSVGAGLSQAGLQAARDVVAIERHMHLTTRDDSRDPGWYFLGIFGQPRETGSWGWRFEGHHLSVNFTVHDGELIGVTPMFIGSQPARASIGGDNPEPVAGIAAAGRALLDSLDASQRSLAIFAPEPPDDVVTQHDARAMRPPRLGIRHRSLDAEQQALLEAVIAAYTARLPTAVAEIELAAVRRAGLEDVRFGWAGGTEPGAAHYFRVQGATFVMEFGHVDGDPNHVHSVWRKFDDDFGQRALRTVRPAVTTLQPTGTTPASAVPDQRAEVAAAADAARAKLELLDGGDVPVNGCDATAEVLDRRPLLNDDPLPRNFYRDPNLEVVTLRIATTAPRDGVENLCVVGHEIEAVSPKHPARLIGSRVFVRLELASDGRASAWRAAGIRPQQ